ncbi:Metallo-beta-lactamase fold-containing protein [Candidatus Tiddalikarchaeum anstoanum]|nr:Metallo-beta-lactamase fold-containing protein [Candidatus Tiddalikarchaeum anstoanum]
MEEVINSVFLLEGECNSYYIDDKIKILIDAGFDFKKHVDFLVLTHIHPDHILFAKVIQERTNCKILVGDGDQIIDSLIQFFPEWHGKKIRQFKADKVLKDGDVINSGACSFKVLAVPGHSKGSIALFEYNNKILFSGDTLFADGIIGRTDFPHSEPKKMESSLEKLKKTNYKILLPGHGKIVL